MYREDSRRQPVEGSCQLPWSQRLRSAERAALTHNSSLEEWLLHVHQALALIPGSEPHGARVVSIAIDPTHDTLVITEEEDGQAGHGIDSDQQRPLVIPAGNVVGRDAIHVDDPEEGCLDKEAAMNSGMEAFREQVSRLQRWRLGDLY